MASTSDVKKEDSPVWQYVPIADYRLPAAPVIQTARNSLSVLQRLFKRDEAETDTLLKQADELRMLPRWQLERIVPALDWRNAAEGLNAQLADWLEQESPEQSIIFLVGPPHSGCVEILTAWAEQQAWQMLKPPSPDQVMAGDGAWLSDQNDQHNWVLPGLEKVYLRHAAGLNLIRRFLDRASSGNLGRGIIGCDSWAWAFLRHVWHGRQPVTLAPQAFQQTQLAEIFQKMADSADNGQLLFRQSDNGRYVLPPPETSEGPAKMSNFLQLLAAHSRGNVGIALALWRASLRTEPDGSANEETGKEDRKLPRQTIWVAPWAQLKYPLLPSGSGRDEAFVLHTLLLHNGMPCEFLQQLLPLSPSRTMEMLFRLEGAGLVSRHYDDWRVTPLGYPAVRQFLQANGYLVDQF